MQLCSLNASVNNRINIFFASAISVLLIACAQVRSITGGEKDSTPPEMLFAEPPPASINFSSKIITLNFNEYVQLNNINQELIISPPLAHAPKIKVKRKSVVVELQDELLPNTTYMFNFGDGITDVNENNKASDMLYVFSTGSFIDSLSLSGNVHDTKADAPLKGMKVMLFENDTDMFAKKTLPIYFAKTKEDGSFTLPYLKTGTFYIYAVDDQNSNYKWDEGEALAMMDSTVQVSISDSASIDLSASIPFPEKPVIKDYVTDSVGRLQFTIDRHFHPVSITSLNGLNIIQHTAGDSIITWIKGKPTNQIELIHVEWNDALSDTVELPFYESAQNRKFGLRTTSNKKIRTQDSLVFFSDQLVRLQNENAIVIKQDSLLVNGKLIPAHDPSQFSCDAKFLPGKNYSIEILPGAFLNEAGSTNDTTLFSFSTYKKAELGLLQFDISNLDSAQNYIFFLFDKAGTEFFRKTNIKNERISIADLPAGEFVAKILSDNNLNQLYDPAIISPYTPSEIMHVFQEKISVRANWEVKHVWKIK